MPRSKLDVNIAPFTINRTENVLTNDSFKLNETFHYKYQSGCEPLNLEKGCFGALEPAVPYYIANNIHEKITRFWLAESSAVQV